MIDFRKTYPFCHYRKVQQSIHIDYENEQLLCFQACRSEITGIFFQKILKYTPNDFIKFLDFQALFILLVLVLSWFFNPA